MKLKIIAFALTLAFALSAAPALAQGLRTDFRSQGTTTLPRVRPEIKAEIEARRASSTERVKHMRAEAQARKASSTERRVEMQRGLAKRKAEHAAKVLMATVERLEKIITRLESRIEKVEANGGNVAEAEAFVSEAKDYLSKAKASIALFASVDLSGDKAQENFDRVKAIAAEVKEHIRQAHTSLMKAVRSLGHARGNATSTPE